MKISRQKSEILVGACILLVIALSGCVYFTQVLRTETTVLFVTLSILLFFTKHKKIRQRNLIVFLFIIFFLAINYFANYESMTIFNLNDYILIIIQLFSLFLLSNSITKEEFSRYYVNIMVIISIISLICLYLQLFQTEFVQDIAKVSILEGYMINWYHTWGWSYIFNRNAGPFWEPGAYQGYLVVAILILFNNRVYKDQNLKLLFLLIALVSTMSTTGYLLLSVLILYFIKINIHDSIKEGKDKSRESIKIILLAVASIFAIQWILNSATLTQKFDSSNGSYLARIADIRNGYDIIINRPFFGYGIMGPKLVNAWTIRGLYGNASGLLSSFQYFGFVFASFYLFKTFRGIIKFLDDIPATVLTLIFSIIFMTESLVTFPVYLAFLFHWETICMNKTKVNGERYV